LSFVPQKSVPLNQGVY